MSNSDNQYGNLFESFTIHRKLFRSDTTPSPLHKNFSTEKGYYLKMHGSIDWTYCRNEGCENYQEVFPIIDPLKTYICRECFEPLDILIIPPLLNKNYRKHPMIRKIWNLAAYEIQAATEIIIWGYSLPPTDFYSKWLLRQGRKAPLNKIILINPDSKKDDFNNKFKNLFKNISSTLTWKYYESFHHFVRNNQIINPE